MNSGSRFTHAFLKIKGLGFRASVRGLALNPGLCRSLGGDLGKQFPKGSIPSPSGRASDYGNHQTSGFLEGFPKGPCTQIVYTLRPMYLCREYFKANVYTIWVHGPLGVTRCL